MAVLLLIYIALTFLISMTTTDFSADLYTHVCIITSVDHCFRSKSDEASCDALYCPSLHEMLPQCDFIVLACPLTEKTNKMISDKEFSLMKKTATLINVSRGLFVQVVCQVTTPILE